MRGPAARAAGTHEAPLRSSVQSETSTSAGVYLLWVFLLGFL